MTPAPVSLLSQILTLLILAVPIACVSWTVTHEDVFAELRGWCDGHSRRGGFAKRKFFYLFTCEYCFSHWVTLLVVIVMNFRLVVPDWRGYLIGGFSLVWLANVYMSLFGRLRLDIRHERREIAAVEKELRAAEPPPPALVREAGRPK